MPGSIWCEHCRDHFPDDHYGQDFHHKVGKDYGPTGAEMQWRHEVKVFLQSLASEPLLSTPSAREEAKRLLAEVDSI